MHCLARYAPRAHGSMNCVAWSLNNGNEADKFGVFNLNSCYVARPCNCISHDCRDSIHFLLLESRVSLGSLFGRVHALCAINCQHANLVSSCFQRPLILAYVVCTLKVLQRTLTAYVPS
jgi:hypothetical protein